jgi:hypothetical protein
MKSRNKINGIIVYKESYQTLVSVVVFKILVSDICSVSRNTAEIYFPKTDSVLPRMS